MFGKKCFSPRPTPANAPLGFFSSSSYEEMMMATHVGCECIEKTVAKSKSGVMEIGPFFQAVLLEVRVCFC